MEKIIPGKYVELAYEVFVVDEDGETSVIKFTCENPDRFVYGVELGMIEGFNTKLYNLEQGAMFDYTFKPSEAFGEVDPEYIHEIDKNVFCVEGEFDDERVKVGAIIPMLTHDHMRIEGVVTEITDDKVVLDFNHQLAGETVRYVGEVLLVRDATDEELHPKHHCGCGCDHDHCDHDDCGHDHDDCGCGHDGCGCS